MSLFKIRDWWTTEVGDGSTDDDICSAGCLLIAQLNAEYPEDMQEQVIVGCHTGSLHLYCPKVTITEEGEEAFGYKPDHLLLETNLNYPVLQLLAGALVGGQPGCQQLCVLHPSRVVVYTVTVSGGRGQSAAARASSANSASHGLQAKLAPAYQHVFKRKAYSAIVGPFGNVRGKDFICVQSLDGCLTVYEQESFAFCVFLPGALLAGPLAYLPKTDSFVTMAASANLQAYKYQNLSVSRSTTDGADDGSSGGKRLTWDWEQVVGEEALEMQVVGEVPLVTLVLLTSRALYAFKESGSLKFVKRLEYNPACFTAYFVGASLFSLVASHSQTLLLYHETVLKWAAQLTCIPVALARVNLKGIKGGVALVTGSGRLQVVYLGTDPSLFTAPPIETREINFDETDKELANLHRIIKASSKDSSSLLSSERSDAQQLTVGITLGQKLEPWTGPSAIQDPEGPVPCCTAVVRLTALQPINGVRVAIVVHKPLAVSQSVFMLRTISDSSQLLVRFYLSGAYVACSLTVLVVTSYTTARGAPRVLRTQLELPLRLVVKASAPNKEADHKITLSTNKPAVNLPELFPEFGLDSSMSSTGVGLQHYAGPLVTVLSSRTTQRYRLQSDSLPALWVVFREMCRRLESYWGTGGRHGAGEETFSLWVSSMLPLNELYSLIDAHFLRRKKHNGLNDQLLQRCLQVRAVQRRLLTKFKDKNPTPLTNLDNLLDGMYKQVLHITDLIQDNTSGLELSGAHLSCVVQLVVQLVKLHYNPGHLQLLAAALSPHMPPPQQTQGWEEVVDCCISFLLRTVCGEDTDLPPSSTLSQPLDTSNLKSRIALLLERLTKGGINDAQQNRGVTDNLDGEAGGRKPSIIAIDPVEVPLGSRLGEDRVRSARIRSARGLSSKGYIVPRLPSGQTEEDEDENLAEEEETNEEQPDEPSVDEREEPSSPRTPEVEEEATGIPHDDIPPEEHNVQSPEATYQNAQNELDSLIDEDEAADLGKPDQRDKVLGQANTQVSAAEGSALDDKSRSLKSAKGGVIESPGEDIFGNPEADEDTW
ncbi:protein PTHB1 isoform X2 [Hyalella azteca]|uniref:Protein PTHB1 isoform X2 n=1 Tax=Hyalella azteca TaxID=294128 RepID=A0A8B7N2D5_HYAAZ|nr:protein PTHB1 isoform X2 [Hyalella azteca]